MAKKKSMELRQPGDTARMNDAILRCERHGLSVRRVSAYQIKIGPWNFWPEKASYNRDDDQAPRFGLSNFFSDLLRWKQQETESHDDYYM